MLSLLLTLLFWCAVIAVVWFIFQKIPVPDPFRWIGYVVIGVIALYVLFGIFGGGGLNLGAPVHIGRLH